MNKNSTMLMSAFIAAAMIVSSSAYAGNQGQHPGQGHPGQGDQGQHPGQGDQGQHPGQGDQGQHPGQGDQGQHPGQGDQGQHPGQGDQGQCDQGQHKKDGFFSKIKNSFKKGFQSGKKFGTKVFDSAQNKVMDSGTSIKKAFTGEKDKTFVKGHYDKNGTHVKGHWRQLGSDCGKK
ncbi:MAG: hypothetical protein HQM10_01580 [Candidatus Riflebacteria bacterium]|nr:hypothetical protein [Candidatus Riflebacteria bacterium]